MKSKKSLLALEVLLGFTIIFMLLFSKRTILSSVFGIKILSVAYVAIAFFMMILIVRQLGDSGKMDRIDEESDNIRNLSRIYDIAGQKRMSKYAETIEVQMRKLDNKSELIHKMLTQNFGQDTRSSEIDNILEEYRSKFLKNVDKIADRMELIDMNVLNPNVSIDANLREEGRQIFNSHIDYIEKKINTNEKITLELDKLTTELTRIDDSEGENNLEPLEDYIKALKQLNDNETEGNEELQKLMSKY